MAANMWKNMEHTCEICGVEIGSERDDEYEEDGETPLRVSGATLEGEEGGYLTLCQDCLDLIINQDWTGLMMLQED